MIWRGHNRRYKPECFLRWIHKYVQQITYMSNNGSNNGLGAKYPINTLRPSDAYMRHQNKLSLVQIKDCRLTGAKPLSGPMMEYYQFDPGKKCVWQCRLENGGHFVSVYGTIWRRHVKETISVCSRYIQHAAAVAETSPSSATDQSG